MSETQRIYPDLPCAFVGCDRRASHVAVQIHDLQLLFGSMAGVVCEDHARQSGAAILSFKGYGQAAKKELAKP